MANSGAGLPNLKRNKPSSSKKVTNLDDALEDHNQGTNTLSPGLQTGTSSRDVDQTADGQLSTRKAWKRPRKETDAKYNAKIRMKLQHYDELVVEKEKQEKECLRKLLEKTEENKQLSLEMMKLQNCVITSLTSNYGWLGQQVDQQNQVHIEMMPKLQNQVTPSIQQVDTLSPKLLMTKLQNPVTESSTSGSLYQQVNTVFRKLLDSFKEEDELKRKYDELERKYTELERKYDELKKPHDEDCDTDDMWNLPVLEADIYGMSHFE